MRRLIVNGYSAHNGHPTRVTLRFNDKGKLLNPRAAARSSLVGWGKWQWSEKIPSHLGNCWWVSTAGHGGYILVTFIKNLPFKEQALKIEHTLGDTPVCVYVYEFEEDCDWAILEYRDELVREHARKQRNARLAELDKPPLSAADYMEDIMRCLREWNPSFIPESANALRGTNHEHRRPDPVPSRD